MDQQAGAAPASRRVDIVQLAEREAWMRAIVSELAETDLSQASVLPGWSVAHILVHLARNADSHRRRIAAAAASEVVDQYPGGAAGREQEINEGIRRPVREILDDVVDSSRLLDAAWLTVGDRDWDAESRDVGGTVRKLHTLPLRRLQEVEVHVVDLGIGVTQQQWSTTFVDAFLGPMRASMRDRLTVGATAPVSTLDERDELWWLYGRGKFDGFPQLAPLGSSTDRTQKPTP
jgi:maleylpyruvate isomerase